MYIQEEEEIQIWHINDYYLKISGISREELEADKNHALFSERTHPDDRDSQRLRERQISDSHSGEYELQKRFVHKDGRVVWVAFTTMRQRLSSGQRVSLHTVKDITPLKKAEEELLLAKEAAERANQSKDAFLAMISHEIRTPLSAILGYADLLANLPPGETRKEYVKTISESGELLLHLIGDILDLSKIEAGRMEIASETFALHDCVQGAVYLLRASARAKNLALDCVIDGAVPLHVVGDSSRLRQTLVNLVGNAVKFTDAGSVRVDVGAVKEPGGVRLEFQIADTGIGIAPEVLPRLFDAYRQGDANISKKFGGTGLGLAITKQIVGLMGGSIRAESTPGKGSLFSFSMPVRLPGDFSD
jgi:PAS domain S-box-containing protein